MSQSNIVRLESCKVGELGRTITELLAEGKMTLDELDAWQAELIERKAAKPELVKKWAESVK